MMPIFILSVFRIAGHGPPLQRNTNYSQSHLLTKSLGLTVFVGLRELYSNALVLRVIGNQPFALLDNFPDGELQKPPIP